jgi:predicted DNA-binding transcriptional regulator AlpA
MDEQELLQEEWGVEQVCEYLGRISRHTLWRLRKRPGFPRAARVGGQLLFNVSQIKGWLRAQRG